MICIYFLSCVMCEHHWVPCRSRSICSPGTRQQSRGQCLPQGSTSPCAPWGPDGWTTSIGNAGRVGKIYFPSCRTAGRRFVATHREFILSFVERNILDDLGQHFYLWLWPLGGKFGLLVGQTHDLIPDEGDRFVGEDVLDVLEMIFILYS